MPKPTPALPDEREDFVIFGAISLARAEVICGRATRIWKAWKVSEVAKDVFDRKVNRFITLTDVSNTTNDMLRDHRSTSSKILGEMHVDSPRANFTNKLAAISLALPRSILTRLSGLTASWMKPST